MPSACLPHKVLSNQGNRSCRGSGGSVVVVFVVCVLCASCASCSFLLCVFLCFLSPVGFVCLCLLSFVFLFGFSRAGGDFLVH